MTNETNVTPISQFIPNLKDFDVRICKESEARYQNAEKILTFGIRFLDEVFGGIFAEDLVVLGAKTGLGKTQLAMHIALANAKQNRRVVYFALEAAEYEIERRIKYQEICNKFFTMKERPRIYLNYMDWYYGRFREELKEIEQEIEEQSFLPQLRIYYRDKDFNVEEFQRVFLAVKHETDLVVIDHLHYFDHDDPNENKAVKDIVKKIKDTVDITRVPVILISHVRKSDRKFKTIVPDIEDFHGSSDIGKIATKAFCISPGQFDESNSTRHTFINIQKCRVDGSRMGWTASVPFNTISQKYESSYVLGRVSLDGTTFDPTELRSIPEWARGARIK